MSWTLNIGDQNCAPAENGYCRTAEKCPAHYFVPINNGGERGSNTREKNDSRDNRIHIPIEQVWIEYYDKHNNINVHTNTRVVRL